MFVAAYFQQAAASRRGLAGLRRAAARPLPHAARRDVRRARASTSASTPRGRSPRAACSSGRRSTSGSTRPTCWRSPPKRGRRLRARPRRLHGRPQRRLLDAAELRGDPRGEHPRGDPPHRHARSAPSSACSARSPAPRAPGGDRARAAAPEPAQRSRWPTCVALPRCASDPPGPAPAGSMSAASRVAVLKGGRSLERAVSLRSGAQVAGCAAASRPRGAHDRRRRRARAAS